MASVSAITPASTGAYQASAVPEKTMSQQDFFKLLTAQLSSQDPMNPVSNAEFMGQMAQFSTLEQTRSLDKTISTMRTEQQLLQANSLIGRAVALQDGDSQIEGIVQGITVESGVPKLMVDGVAYKMSQVIAIAPAIATQI